MPEEEKPEEKAAKPQKPKDSDGLEKPKAAKPIVKSIAKSIKKKKWYDIIAPDMFGDRVIGETFVTDFNAVVGKTLKINLMTLTNDMKKQNVNLKFVVKNIRDNMAVADVTGYEMVSSSIKRLVKRGKKRVDPSFVCYTSDEVRVRVKALLLAGTNIKASVSGSLRKAAIDFLTKNIEKTSYSELVNALMAYKVQRNLRDELKRIYPLKVCEIREMSIEKEKKSEDKIKGKGLRQEIKKEEIKEEPKERKKAKVENKEEKPLEEEPKKEETKEVKKEEQKEEENAPPIIS